MAASSSSSVAVLGVMFAAACGSSRPPPDHPPSFDLDAAVATPVIVPADAAPPPDALPGPTTFTVPAVPVTVTRVTTGKGKAEVLRYAFAESAQDLSLEVDTSVEVTIGTGTPTSQVVPTIDSTSLVGIVGVTAGVATTRFRLATTHTTDDQIEAQLAELHDTQLDSTMDAQGRPGDVVVTSLASDQATAATIASLDQARIHAIPLPAEPIAVGGSWRVVGTEDINGIATEMTTTYHLVSRTGHVVKLIGEIRGKVATQTLHRADGDIEVKSGSSSGKLTATIDLERLAPELSTSQTSDATMELNTQAIKARTTTTWVQKVADHH